MTTTETWMRIGQLKKTITDCLAGTGIAAIKAFIQFCGGFLKEIEHRSVAVVIASHILVANGSRPQGTIYEVTRGSTPCAGRKA